MKRRDLIALFDGAALGYPLVGRGQPNSMPVIGFLNSASPGPSAPYVTAFRKGLSEADYVEGKNVAIDYRWAEDRYDRLPAMASDLVSRKVDVIATGGGLVAARAAKHATSTIPIVFLAISDPVEDGLVASLARPGENMTGLGVIPRELLANRFELLSELVPQAGTVAMLVNPKNPRVAALIPTARKADRKSTRL